MMVLKDGEQVMYGPTQEVLTALKEKRAELIGQQQKRADAKNVEAAP